MGSGGLGPGSGLGCRDRVGSDWIERQWYVTVHRYDMVWYGMVWYVRYGMVWCGMVWYGMAWYGVVRYD